MEFFIPKYSKTERKKISRNKVTVGYYIIGHMLLLSELMYFYYAAISNKNIDFFLL